MSIEHSAKRVAAALHARSLARIIKRKLRERGYMADYIALHDAYGARLRPFDLMVGEVHVMVRSVGTYPIAADRAALSQTPGAYLQLGAHDITGLLEHMARYRALSTASHWAQA